MITVVHALGHGVAQAKSQEQQGGEKSDGFGHGQCSNLRERFSDHAEAENKKGSADLDLLTLMFLVPER
jgi:hypothetical protein